VTIDTKCLEISQQKYLFVTDGRKNLNVICRKRKKQVYYYESKAFDRFTLCYSKSGLHNSESSKDQIYQNKFAAGRKSLFLRSLEEILKRQLVIRSCKNGESKSITVYFHVK